ncbi:MAG: hypothetical protein K6U74_14775 [Firmicutes bacterium]|nr:hypothetical protein [Bacillota bacterium]
MENKKGTRVLGVRKIERQDVYNMEVEDHHNFSVEGGLIVHNCMDRNRYFVFTRFGKHQARATTARRGMR